MNTKMNFEQAINKLEKIVEELETGELTLDDSLEKFKEGIELSSYCNKKLDEVDKKISILIEKDNEILEKPFNVNKEDKVE